MANVEFPPGTLGAHYEDFIRHLVECGRFASASDVVRAGLRLLEQREAASQATLETLRAEIAAAAEGPFEPLDMDAVKAEARALARGLADVRSGRVMPLDEACQRLREDLVPPSGRSRK